MAAGVTDRLWGIGDIVKVLEDWETSITVALSVLCGLCGLRPDGRVARWTMR
jgi:hypothetical protein